MDKNTVDMHKKTCKIEHNAKFIDNEWKTIDISYSELYYTDIPNKRRTGDAPLQ